MIKVNIKHLGDFRFCAKSEDRQITIAVGKRIAEFAGDMPLDSKAILSPLETFLISVGSCVGVYAVKYCQNAKIDSNGIEIIVTSDLGDSKPIRFEKIDVKINLNQDIADRKKSLLAFVKNCPIHNTLIGNPRFEFSI